MGLLDNISAESLMDIGAGLLAAGGPSRTPVSLGQAIAGGYQAYQQGDRMRRKDKLEQEQFDLQKSYKTMQEQMMQAQLAKAKQDMEYRQKAMSELGSIMQPQSTLSGYQMAPDNTGYVQGGAGLDMGNPNAQSDYMAAADKLLAKKQSGQQLTEVEQLVLNTIAGSVKPVYTQTTQGIDRKLADMAVKYSAVEPELAKSWAEISKLYKDEERKPGSYYRNPVTGATEYVGDPTKGVTVGKDGSIKLMSGYDNLAKLAGVTEAAKEAGVQSAKAPYADPVVLKGAGQGGGDVIVPRVNVPSLNGQINSQSPIVTQGTQDFNSNWIKNSYQPTQDAGSAAGDLIGQVQTLRQIDMNTGWGSELKAGAASVLAGLGVAPKNAELYAANSEKFQQVSMERLWTTLNAAKGPQTEGDADRAKQTFVSLKNTPQANAFILDLAEAKANRDKMKASYYQDAQQLAQRDGNYGRVDQEWRKIQRSVWDDPLMQKWVRK